MTYQIIWDDPALAAASRFFKDDPHGLQQVFASVDLLADDPRPSGAAAYGPTVYRMRVGFYRVIYEITESTVTIMIMHLGRAA
ncbi:type II toxin-antitoxin system RelE family toxin [Streptomyces flavofungini]|uniref:type II toxin-antitoxin system RelE family toxin n=1 Tax=Streptomyces flavofungini TaxID=68200 RepID=UPI0025B1DAAD|nr:type II toxin-antitoxin system RelE/ParE family toxin [Streptomyces flavofungini]WJV48234.1 type II toxin-antitoxin system RelE/ParE family toxin [Streptomyces flavofungini]